MNKLTDTFKLHNGVEIPCVGFGTWQTKDGETAVNSVVTAIEAGYRHIDTAAAYGNEGSVGEAIIKSGINRKELFVTSKLWNTERGYDTTLKAFDVTMEKLQLDYLDLYLIHWPANAKNYADWKEINGGTWRAMEELYKAGRIRSIGVSNFKSHHLDALLEAAEIVPMVNQIEYHPGQMRKEDSLYCKEHNILVEAYSPLGTGRMLENEQLIEIAGKYGVSAAQLCIRWCLQNGVLPLPKSVTPSRIIENSKVFGFEISDEDMNTINAMPDFGSWEWDSDVDDFR